MAKPNRRQPSSRAARRADILLALADAAAESVCDGTTFVDLSVERLSRQAGISRASFYLYFEDKGELVRGWYDALDGRVSGVLTEWWEADNPTGELLSGVLSGLAAEYAGQRFVVNAVQETSAHDPLLREALDDAFQRRTVALRKHIARGQRAGWIDSELVAATTAPWLVAMIDRVMEQVAARETSDPSLIETGADIIRHSLYTF
jgi:TetR/AcrR family transcriptional regulator, ethionamide resistance regulator